MHPAVRRNRRITSWSEKLASLGGAFVGTFAMMAVMVILVSGRSCMWGDRSTLVDESHAAERADDVELRTTCAGDVLLATASRAALCLSPWSDGPAAQCGEDAVMMMWMDVSSCEARSMPAAPVAMAMLEPRQIEKLTPIDPEPLLEELMQKEKPPQPVPPPQPQPPQQQPPPPPPAPPPPARKQQVVETVKPQNEQAPDPNTRLLSEYDIKVDKQKVNRGARNEPLVAKAKPEDLVAKKDPPKDDPSMQKPPDKPPGKNDKAPDNPTTLSMRPPGSQAPTTAPQEEIKKGDKGDKQPVLSGGMVPRRGDGAIEQQRKDPGELTKGQGGGGGGTPQVPNLKPTKEQLERIAGGGSVDHLEDVDNGDETALSAKRWVYASFFNRLKRQVAQNWDPQTVWRRVDPQGTHNGFKTRVTEVRVVLSNKGELNKIVVTSPSGVNELDDEAVRAFHAAAPFVNPPDGLAGKDGTIAFAFAFYFEIGTPHTAWRMIRTN